MFSQRSRLTTRSQRGKRRIINLTAAIAAITGFVATPAAALTFDLNFSSLPSAQGWSFGTATGLPESAFASVNGTSLIFSTVGTGYYGGAIYYLSDVIDVTKSFSLELTARVLAEEYDTTGALSFLATAPGVYSGFFLGMGNFHVSDKISPPPTAIDNTVFHDYRLNVQLDGSYELSIDGSLAQSGAIYVAALPNLIYFGDGSSGVNGKVEISRLTFQQPIVEAIPEPASPFLFLSGLATLIGLRSGRRKL